MIFDIQWGKEEYFNKRCWDHGISTCKRMKLDPYHITNKNINCKLIKNLNIKAKPIKLLKENMSKFS